VAVVTGAASGIGRATALLFALEGAKVVVADIDEKKGRQTAQEVAHAGGTATFVKVDGLVGESYLPAYCASKGGSSSSPRRRPWSTPSRESG